MSEWDESALISEAQGILGPGEEVVGAGVFGLSNLVLAQAAGVAVGDIAGGLGDPITDALGAVAVSMAAKKLAADTQGVTLRMLVAITADTIHVLNRDTGGRLRTEVASFPRHTSEVSVRKMGASRFLSLTDPATGTAIELHGSVGWISAQAKGDKVVFELLAEEATQH